MSKGFKKYPGKKLKPCDPESLFERNEIEVEILGVRHTIEVSKEQLEKIRSQTHFSSGISLDVSQVSPSKRTKLIYNTTKDLAVKFLYYNRKEDEELPVGSIEEAVKSGETSIAEIVAVFEKALRDQLV